MRAGIDDLMSGVETCVKREIEKSGGVIMRSCMISSYDSHAHTYTGTIDAIEYTNIKSIVPSTTYTSGDVVCVLANSYRKSLNNITIIGKVQ
jgi:hypothetical protein